MSSPDELIDRARDIDALRQANNLLPVARLFSDILLIIFHILVEDEFFSVKKIHVSVFSELCCSIVS